MYDLFYEYKCGTAEEYLETIIFVSNMVPFDADYEDREMSSTKIHFGGIANKVKHGLYLMRVERAK